MVSPNSNSTRIEDSHEKPSKADLAFTLNIVVFIIFLPLVYIPLSRHQWFSNFSVLVELAWNLRPLLLLSSPLHHTSSIVWYGRTWVLSCLLSLNNNSTLCYAASSRFDHGKAIWRRAWKAPPICFQNVLHWETSHFHQNAIKVHLTPKYIFRLNKSLHLLETLYAFLK